MLLSKYTGVAPLQQRYTADRDFLENCNGFIVAFKSNERIKTDCAATAFANVRQMAWVLGSLTRSPDPTINHAVTAYTDGGTLTANSVQFATLTPIALTATNRFITFSVNAAEANCNASHAKFKFYLLNGSTEIPTFATPIDPCSDPTARTITAPAVGEYPAKEYKVGAFAGNAATLFSGSLLGIRLRNGQASTQGNDAAFDDIQVLDATPQLDKSFSPSVLSVGAISQLTFTITNTSELAAKNGWAFTDTLPTGLVVAAPASAATTCSQPTTIKATANDRTISVAGSLAAGMNYCTVTVNVTSADKGSYTNGPQDVTSETGINPPGPATVTFTTNADLQIEKSATPTTAIPGSDETYTLKVTNKGPDTAENVVVTDRLPAGLSLVSASPGCQPVATTVTTPPRLPASRHRRRTAAPGAEVRCTIGSMDANASVTLTLLVHVASSVTDGFLNSASVSSTTPDPDLSNNEAAVITPVPPEADLEIKKTASLNTVTAGGQVTYTLVVKNNGPHDATEVIVADHQPLGLNVASAEPSQGTCAHGSGVLCSLGSVSSGASAQILVTADVALSAGGALTNVAVVAGGQTDPNLANNSAAATVDVTPLTPDPLPPAASDVLTSITTSTALAQGFSDLRIVKRVDHATVRPGQRLTYKLKITNDGIDDAPAVTVIDTWSVPLNIISAHPSQGTCHVAQPLSCALGTVRRNASATITIVARARRSGRVRNTARVASANRDPDLSNNESSAESDVIPDTHRNPPAVTG